MSILSRTRTSPEPESFPEPKETSGHDLLNEYQTAVKSFQAQLDGIQADARDRATVVESRLQELEAEKLVLNLLSTVPTVDVTRSGEVTGAPVSGDPHDFPY